MQNPEDDGTRRAKNIAAIVYLCIMTFLVGGSYIHQHRHEQPFQQLLQALGIASRNEG